MSEQISLALTTTKYMPYWLDNPQRPEPERPLEEDIETDLLIVGGGFTGLWTAVQAKELNPDRKVVLIEANTTASGASGRPGAVLSTSLMHGMEHTHRLYENELETLDRLGRENMDQFRATIEKYQIDCDVEWTGEMIVAIGEQGIEDIKNDYERYRKLGHDAHLLDRHAVQSEINSPLFDGGMWSKKQSGTIHPAKMAWGLKRVAKELGVSVHDHTSDDWQ